MDQFIDSLPNSKKELCIFVFSNSPKKSLQAFLAVRELYMMGRAIKKAIKMAAPTLFGLRNAVSFLPKTTLLQRDATLFVETELVSALLKSDFSFIISKKTPNTAKKLISLTESLYELVSQESRKEVKELSRALSRKINGARDALDNSRDSVSQASNSLVEFIDRLITEVFTTEEILLWLQNNKHAIQGNNFTYLKQGNILCPTTTGKALCFVYAGEPVPKKISIYAKTAAEGIKKVREELQKIKHADTGTQEEKELVKRALDAVEGFFLFAIKFGWSSSDKHDLLKKKFAASKRAQ